MEYLELCYRSLCACGDRPIADGSLLDFLRQVSTFGLPLVRLDIRQESERHTDVLDAITKHLDIDSYREWSEERRQEWLLFPDITLFLLDLRYYHLYSFSSCYRSTSFTVDLAIGIHGM